MVKSQYFQKCLEITSCTNGDCGDKAKFECTTHNMELCVNCLCAYHITCCKFETLPYSVMECIFDLCKKLISRISKFGTNHQLDQKYVGFSDSLNVLVGTYTKIKSKDYENKNLSEMIDLKDTIISSQAFNNYSTYKAEWEIIKRQKDSFSSSLVSERNKVLCSTEESNFSEIYHKLKRKCDEKYK